MKVKVTDQLHISSVRADSIRAGETIEVSDDVGNDLVKRGLATKIAAAPPNKARQTSRNKAGGRRR